MSKGIYLLVVCVLAAVAVVGSLSVGILSSVPPVDISEEEPKGAQSQISSDTKTVPEIKMESAEVSLQDLWEHTLFKPERTEAEESPEAAAVAAEQQVNAEFELAGIARVGQAEQAQPVAIIRMRQKSTRGNSSNNRRGLRNNQPQPQPQEQGLDITKTVFKIGDKINNTGYTLKSIIPEEKMVEVSRGSEVIKLYIDYTSELSQARRKTAAAQEEAGQAQRAKVAAETARNVAETAKKYSQPPVRPATGQTATATGQTAPVNTQNGGGAAKEYTSAQVASQTQTNRDAGEQRQINPGGGGNNPPSPPSENNGEGRVFRRRGRTGGGNNTTGNQ